MTSIAFILSVVPLVLATGAGLAVLFVPSLFVVIQRFEEGTKAKDRPAETVAAE